MVQALGSVKDEPSSLFICGHDAHRVESFVCLGAMIHSSCSSDPEIHSRRHSSMTRSAMQSLDWHLWRSWITNKTKLHLYRVFILPIMLYGSECWARRIYSGLMQWTNGDYEESWTFAGTTLSEMPTSVKLLTSHHFRDHPSLSPIVSLCLGMLHEWMRMQMLAKPSSNLL